MFVGSIVRTIPLIAAVVLSATNDAHAQQSYAVIAQNGVAMKTRDGLTLYSDIYRPRADGKFPVILMRTPYDKSVSWAVTPPEAQPTRYFLHSGGSANSLRGDGGLSLTPPRKETPDKFTYDPANAVPTVGGSLCCDAGHYEPGPRDQRTIESRNDVLVCLFHQATWRGYGGDWTGHAGALGRIFRRGHGFHGQARGRLTRRLRHESHRRNSALALSSFAGETRAGESGPGVQNFGGSVGYKQCLSEGPHHALGSFQQQFPALRSQPEHRRGSGDEPPVCFSHQHDPARCRASLSTPGFSDSSRSCHTAMTIPSLPDVRQCQTYETVLVMLGHIETWP